LFLERARSRQALALLIDGLCIVAAFGAALALRLAHDHLPLLAELPSIPWDWTHTPRSDYALLLVTNVSAWTLWMRRSRLYATENAERMARVLPVYAKGLAVAILCTGGVVFAAKMSISRLMFAYFYLTIPILLVAKQAVWAALFARIRREPGNRRHALVIGPSQPGAWLSRLIDGAGGLGYDLVGLVPIDEEIPAGVPVCGRLDELESVLRDNRVDEVFVIGAAGELARLAPIAQSLIERGRVVSLVTAFRSGPTGVRGRVTEFSGIPVMSFGPMPRDEVQNGTKRALDLTVAGLALFVLSPLLLAVGLAVRLADRGPALFRQRRLGLGGRPFFLFKFRSMRPDAEAVLRADPVLHARYVANDFKLSEDEDPRITSLGRFLRKSSLDELPQLWNVLRGDMTLVGPRPICPGELENYEPYGELYLSARPGLTGHWQVSGRSEVRYPERAFLDLDYIGNSTFRTDMGILLRTIPAVIRRRGVV
jgi:exopolysaccharide biosynthesis polyprenyl glycosylphosphotransferase